MQLPKSDVGKAVALGGAFQSHLEEKERTYRWPDLWILPKEALVNEGEPIQLPERVDQVNPGSELTAVIGEEIYEANEEEAWRAIKGFTISNDVTATGDWPGWSDPDHEMITGVGYKLLPTFSPVLSEYAPKGNESDYSDLHIEVRVDGEVAVDGSTAQMSFSIPELISFASHICVLHENDVVALGDPGTPQQTLDNADEVVCSIESIGELRNPVKQI